MANGPAPDANPPVEWSESKNIKWKVALPGEGSSTPVIWGDRIFLTAASSMGKPSASVSTSASTQRPDTAQPNPRGPGGDKGSPAVGGRRRGGGMFGIEKPTQPYRFMVLCLDRRTGKPLWESVAREEVPHEGHHPTGTYAGASPVTDGQLVFVFFGSRGLHCFDLNGALLWQKDFGHMRTKNSFGEGSSPALHGDTVVVNWDQEGDSFITALDKRTGKERWRQRRDEGTGWSTPLIIDHEGQAQVVVNATGKVRGYDLATGTLRWEAGGQTANAIPSPVSANGMVYVTSGFRGSTLQAIRLGKTGELTGTDAIAWRYDRDTPYVPSPLL
ncbi:MAG: PQQ-like beta-propeller repeat protein, partial [Pedosphaera parvula]|nr:PQQ-like beta-propeller repeat protein [Pedosphaera parvula]